MYACEHAYVYRCIVACVYMYSSLHLSMCCLYACMLVYNVYVLHRTYIMPIHACIHTIHTIHWNFLTWMHAHMYYCIYLYIYT